VEIFEQVQPLVFSEWAAAERKELQSLGARSCPVSWVARCESCREEYCPSGEEIVLKTAAGEVLVEHYGTEFRECGGFGILLGSWHSGT